MSRKNCKALLGNPRAIQGLFCRKSLETYRKTGIIYHEPARFRDNQTLLPLIYGVGTGLCAYEVYGYGAKDGQQGGDPRADP